VPDAKVILAELSAAPEPDAYLRGLHPGHEQFRKLRQVLMKLRASLAGGDRSAPTSGIETSAISYGQNLQQAALEKDPRPRAEIEADIDLVLVNMERWRWLTPELGAFHVWNNVPEFLTRVVKDGKIVSSDRIVAGQPDWPTPVFSADMKTIVFHPSWGVPDGIKRKELAPLLRNSSGGGLFGLFSTAPSSRAVL
jgi:murein L,D-transpeptidase YcbB/YkuD